MRELIESFARRRVLVVGDALLDCWLEGTPVRFAREAPAPVVQIERRVDAAGGAANVAANVATLGATSVFLGRLGTDDEGERLATALCADGVDVSRASRTGATPTLHRVVASDQVLLRFDRGARRARDDEPDAPQLQDALRLAWQECDAVIVSDYDQGVVGALGETISELQRRDPRFLVLDSKQLVELRWLLPTAVKPNWSELCATLGIRRPRGARVDEVLARTDELLARTGARIAAVTLDIDGAVVFERDGGAHRALRPVTPVRHAIGGGDTFTAAFTCALASGADVPTAGDVAVAAAAIAVEKQRTATCSARELVAATAITGKVLRSLPEVADVVATHRASGRRIVFTNGCFDILHRGHISYLDRARGCGDVLVVGVNDDASVARLKGPTRPVNTLEDRIAVLAALRAVDHIVPFSEDMPEALLRAICPDVYAKGDDYSFDTLPEAALVRDLGARVEFLPLVDDRSTTRLIDRIRMTA